MKQSRAAGVLRRVEAGLLAAVTLWAAAVTAGSDTAAGALRALWAALPLQALRWELGDLWPRDSLSPAAALTIGESPLLAAARPAVAELRALERQELPEEDGETPRPQSIPVEETPLDTPPAAPEEDNGVPAKTLVPTDPSGYTVCGRVYISNSTGYALSPEELAAPFAAALTREGPQLLIVHTHGSEAYTPAGGGEDIVWSGDYRTTDTRWNVVKVGDEMAEAFGEAGISVLHDRTLYDYPSYSGAYDRSLAAVERYLEQYPSIRFILDVHRDAIEDAQGRQYKAVTEAEGRTAAQLSLVVGSDGSGLTHPDWRENLKLAAAVQENILAKYPALMRPVLLRNSRYNQHASPGFLLVEVGAAGNSPEEAALSGRLFARQMAEVMLGTLEEPAETPPA